MIEFAIAFQSKKKKENMKCDTETYSTENTDIRNQSHK